MIHKIYLKIYSVICLCLNVFQKMFKINKEVKTKNDNFHKLPDARLVFVWLFFFFFFDLPLIFFQKTISLIYLLIFIIVIISIRIIYVRFNISVMHIFLIIYLGLSIHWIPSTPCVSFIVPCLCHISFTY